MTLREARIGEIEALIALRASMFEAMGHEAAEIEAALPSMRAYFAEHMATGAFRVWVAEADDQLVSSIGLVIHSIPPSPRNHVGKEAYVMNLVTMPAYRRQGIAKALLAHVLEVVNSESIPVVSLHASREGQSLYQFLGFRLREDVPEMTLRFGR